MILSTLSAAGAAVLLVAGGQGLERGAAPDLQDEIHRAINAQSKTERDTALDALRANAGDEHEVLIRELFTSSVNRPARGRAWPSRLSVARCPYRTNTSSEPLFEGADESSNAALSDALSEFESHSVDGRADFTAYVAFLTGEAPPGLVRHMRSIDQSAASRALALARESDNPEDIEWIEQRVAETPVFALEEGIRPVTAEELANPGASDWLTWRRTLDGQGYSPLEQITTDNVDRLRLAWSWSLGPGSQQTTPLVHDGLLNIANPGEVVQALDAATGDLLSSGSIVADGNLVSGLTGCGRYRDDTCYIVGLDAHTGNELWRTSTIAVPGERGGDTWGDLPVMFRAGSDSWIPGSYDPVTRTLFHGTSQAKPWARVVRGTDGDALYTNSTLALEPETGEMKWYFQHIPGETLDMDESFERILVEYDGQRSVFTMGKMGVLWEAARPQSSERSNGLKGVAAPGSFGAPTTSTPTAPATWASCCR